MSGYYDDKLAAERLRRVYELASPRVRRYLAAELEYVRGRLGPGDVVLELGCGYGRVLEPLAERVRLAVGVDTSFASLALAREELGPYENVRLINAGGVALRQLRPGPRYAGGDKLASNPARAASRGLRVGLARGREI